MKHVPIAVALVLVLALPAGLSAAEVAQTQTQASPQPIYAAFSLLKQGKLTMKRCGGYSITTGTYTGRSSSPDARLAGSVTYTGRISLHPGGTTGVATGTLTIRDSARAVRMRSNVNGVITERSVVNGNVVGSVLQPDGAPARQPDDGLRRSALVRGCQARARDGEELGDRVSGDPEVLGRRNLFTHAR